MTTKTETHYQHLEPCPGSNYRQLFLKGRRIRAAVVDEAIHGPDPFTPEEFASEYQVPLEAVLEALEYVAQNRPLIEQSGTTRRPGSMPGVSTCPRRNEIPCRREPEQPTSGLPTPGSGARPGPGQRRQVAVGHGCESAYIRHRPSSTRFDSGFRGLRRPA